MKICLISRKFDINSGSAEWIYASFLDKEFNRRNITVYKISEPHLLLRIGKFGKIIHDWLFIPLALFKVRIFNKCDIFFFLSENQAIYCIILNIILNASTICYFHDLMRIKKKKKTLDSFYFKIIYWLATKAKLLIVNSTSTKEDIVSFFSVAEKKIFIIPPIYRQLKPLHRIKNKITVGYLGALYKRKRPEKLIELAEELKRSGKNDVEIHVWGKGPMYDLLNSYAKNNPNFKVLGFAPEGEIERIYNSFHFFIFPSKYEGFGLPVIEALMCGIPTLVLSDAYIPEEVKSCCTVYSNVKEMIQDIYMFMQNKEKYNEISMRAESNAKNFNMDVNVTKILKIINSLETKHLKQFNACK